MTNKDLLSDTAKGALLGTAIGALTGNVGRGALIGTTAGLGYNVLFKSGGVKRKRSKGKKVKSPSRKRRRLSPSNSKKRTPRRRQISKK